ncbi:MAG: transglycosylase SLT domain-containing protein [Anaerolineae bacterium]|nr:transglycosylase SLT domain-containing protein [Anaerolineae bacterium]
MRFRGNSRWLILIWITLASCVILAGCADAPPTPTAPVPSATATITMPTGVPATAGAAVTDPAPTPTATARSSPTPTHTSSPSPTPTWTPTLAPSPMAEPSAQLDEGLELQANGEYDLAIEAFLGLLADSPTASQAREAHYRLAETYLLDQQYAAAAAAWEQFLAQYPDDDRLPDAQLMAARAYHATNEWQKALPYYEAYLAARTVLADMVYEWIGDAHAALAVGSADMEAGLKEAIAAYRQAVQAVPARSARVGLLEKIAGVYVALGDHESAVAEYDAILAVARIDGYRARIEYQAGQALEAAGQIEAAHGRYRRALDRYPQEEYAYISLIRLVDAGIAVDEFQRGLVDYYAGEQYPDAYPAAIAAFDRYLATGPGEKSDEALYRKALCQRALEQPQAAMQTLEALIAGYPESDWLAPAWLAKGAAYATIGDTEAAVKTYRDAAAFFPADALAPQALWRAAVLREGERRYADAADLFRELQASFPSFEDASDALWRSGFAYYRAGDQQQAVESWQILLEGYPRSAYRAKVLYWLGKLGAEPAEGDGYWVQLVTSDPNDYYALRVKQIESGEPLTGERLVREPVQAPAWDPAAYAAEILPWLRGWTEVPTGTQSLDLPAAWARRVDLRRGEALLDVGLRREALTAFDGARTAAWDDPLALAQLSVYFTDKGLPGLAARCAARLAGLWPEGGLYAAPQALRRVVYPLAYTDLLSAAAQEYDLDPLLLAALIRQESLFEKAAESYAGARGLGQVMPATGQGIANSLGLEDFSLDDLYRPSVSVEFGAFYLSVQMRRFDQQLLIALAAYNGGPGNTLRWLEAGGDDLDLFVEVITASQSRLYLQLVYQHYLVYEDLYRSTGS